MHAPDGPAPNERRGHRPVACRSDDAACLVIGWVMAVFSLHEANRIVSAPGSRRAAYSVEDAVGVVRETLAHLEWEGLTEALFPALMSDPPADYDPELGPVLGLCGPRPLTREGIAILPPGRRFNCVRGGQVYRIFVAGRWTNGVNGYALAPSDWRPGLAVWGYSEGGLYQETEWGSVAEWLIEFVAPLCARKPLSMAGATVLRPGGAILTRTSRAVSNGKAPTSTAPRTVSSASSTSGAALLQKGEYEHSWPQGRWTVHPAATVGPTSPSKAVSAVPPAGSTRGSSVCWPTTSDQSTSDQLACARIIPMSALKHRRHALDSGSAAHYTYPTQGNARSHNSSTFFTTARHASWAGMTHETSGEQSVAPSAHRPDAGSGRHCHGPDIRVRRWCARHADAEH